MIIMMMMVIMTIIIEHSYDDDDDDKEPSDHDYVRTKFIPNKICFCELGYFHKIYFCGLQYFYKTRPQPAFGRRSQNGSSVGDQFGSCKRLTPCFAPPALSLEGKQLFHPQERRSLFRYSQTDRQRYTPPLYIHRQHILKLHIPCQ